MSPEHIVNAVLLVVVNVCGYVALGKRLERVEIKLDDKVSVEEHDATVTLLHLKIEAKADRV